MRQPQIFEKLKNIVHPRIKHLYDTFSKINSLSEIRFILAIVGIILYLKAISIYGTNTLLNIEDKISPFSILVLIGLSTILLFLVVTLRDSFFETLKKQWSKPKILKYEKRCNNYLLLLLISLSTRLLDILRKYFFNAVKKHWSKPKILKYEKRCNNYLLFAIVLSMILFLIGITYIDARYNKVPFEIVNWYPDTGLKEFITISKATCYSLIYYKTFVMNGTIYCDFNIEYGSTPYRLTAISIDGWNSITGPLPTQRSNYTGVNATEYPYRFFFNIPAQDYVIDEIHLLFNDNTDKPWYNTTIGIYEIVPLQKYGDWMSQKTIAFLAILSAIFITVTVSVSNLKKIIEDK